MALAALLGSVSAQAGDYTKMWKEVERLEGKSLPQSAISQARKIFQSASRKGDKAEMLRAYLYIIAQRGTLSVDSVQPDIQRMETWTEETRDKTEQAVLHALLGSLYMDKAGMGRRDAVNRVSTDAETRLSASLPEYPADMSEWTVGMFRQKARAHFTASLADPQRLGETSLTAWLPVIQKGTMDEKLGGGNLLDVIGQTAVRTLPRQDSLLADAFYRKMVAYYRQKGNTDGEILASLRQAQLAYRNGMLSKEVYCHRLEKMMEKYRDARTCPDIYADYLDVCDLKGEKKLAFVRDVLKRFPDYDRKNLFLNAEKELTLRRSLRIDTENVLPGKPLKAAVQWKNMDNATVSFYKIKDGFTSAMYQDYDKNGQWSAGQKSFFSKYVESKPFLTHKIALDGRPYEDNDSAITLPSLPAGLYAVRIDGKDGYNCQLLSVSSLRAIGRSVSSTFDMTIVDALSGKPVPNATVIVYEDNKGAKEITRLSADAEGRVSKVPKGWIWMRLETSEDRFSLPDRVYSYVYGRQDSRTEEESGNLFTDRAVYRPGQRVQVAGVFYRNTTEKSEALPDKKVTLTLRDANDQKISERTLTTNEFGSVATSFTLPDGGLSGMYRVESTQGASVSFRVEEYKRPTFDVRFDKVEEVFKAGDSLTVRGIAKTYAGVPLANAKVAYTVQVRRNSWMRWDDGVKIPDAVSKVVETDEQGRFAIPVQFMTLPGKRPRFYWYDYEIKADVTSSAGETQQGTLTLPLSNRAVYMDLTLMWDGGCLRKEAAEKGTVFVRNLQNLPVACKGTYTLYQIDKLPERQSYRWDAEMLRASRGKKVLEGSFEANKEQDFKEVYALKTGAYRMVCHIDAQVDGKQLTATDSTDFVLFSEKDMRPALPSDIWFQGTSYEMSSVEDGGKVGKLQVGTSLKDVSLFYELYAGEERIDHRIINLSDSILNFTYPYKEEYGNKDLTASFAFVKDGEFYQRQATIRRVFTRDQLQIAWTSFRDRLVPGQKETWTLKVSRKDGTPAKAEVMASMYDASLDKFDTLRWWLNPFRLRTYSYVPSPSLFNEGEGVRLQGMYKGINLLRVSQPTYSVLNLMKTTGQTLVTRADVRLYKHSVLAMSGAINAPMALSESKVFVTGALGDSASPKKEVVPLRANFNETAFFYPQVPVNEKGEATLSFTLPESLTQWRVKALAHTKDMLWTQTDTTVTATKDFMLQPNLPRYVRKGDKVYFPATLTNLTGKRLKGEARFSLIDPATEKVLFTRTKNFRAEAGQTDSLSFEWDATATLPALICRYEAKAGKKTDGEQNWLMVLDNRQQVVQSVAVSVNGKETKSYSLKSLFQHNDPQAENRRLTVEFTSNPMWYAVQALPSMVEANGRDAVSVSAAYYAESLAGWIASRNPKLRSVFERWRQEGADSETLWSKLRQNKELKTFVLNETPWVAEAQSETERQRRLGVLFEVNTLAQHRESTLRQLQALQRTDGAWSWFPGMEGSTFITLQVAEQLARLRHITGENPPLLDKAMAFLKEKVSQSYQRAKKQKDYVGGTMEMRYFYLCALRGDVKKEAMTSFYLKGWKTHLASLSHEEKALCAVILRNYGDRQSAEDNVKSLVEHTVHTEEMGRYFDRASYRASWNDNRIPLQTLVIEALAEQGGYPQEMAQMQQWLLKQKQTQAWANPLQSANSVYALLLGSGKEDLHDGQPASVRLNGEEVKSEKETAALGYVRQTFSQGSPVMKPETLTVSKSTSGIAWGSVSASFTLPMERVLSSVADSLRQALTIRRELYIERVVGGKKVRYALNAVRPKVGDQLVSRLIVKTDRDLEFVQVKDLRPACAEPMQSVSGYRFADGRGYYYEPSDVSDNAFCDRLSKGTFIMEHTSYIDRKGAYTIGAATVQCAYAPELNARTEAVRMEVR